MKVKFDSSNEISVKDHFIFVEDPAVTSVDPRISLVRYTIYLRLSLLAAEGHDLLLFCRASSGFIS